MSDYLLDYDSDSSSSDEDLIQEIEDNEFDEWKQLRSNQRELQISAEIFLDTEYTDSEELSIQSKISFTLLGTRHVLNLVLLNEKYKDHFSDENLENFSKTHDAKVVFRDFSDDARSLLTTTFMDILKSNYSLNFSYYKTVKIACTLYFFYAINDLSIAFGYSNMEPFYNGEKGTLLKKRNLVGGFTLKHSNDGCEIVFFFSTRDLVGIDVGSLENIAKSCGLSVF